MKLFTIGDLHLSLQDGQPRKPMHVFGEQWRDHHLRIAEDWRARVGDDDVVLLAGDTSWAMRAADVAEDLKWIEALPGRKVMIKGNHDYWMQSPGKTRKLLPPSISLLWNDSQLAGDVLLTGARLWDMPGLVFHSAGGQRQDEIEGQGYDAERDEKILQRELNRLQLSFDHARKHHGGARRSVCVTHYPPVDFEGATSEASGMIASAGVDLCVFGHLHYLRPGPPSVTADGVRYLCVACDYVDFALVEIDLA
jgi:uncharacterized protein